MMSWDPRKRTWSMSFSVHPPPAEPWIRRALTVSRTAFRTCRAIVSLASVIGSQMPVAVGRRNRERRHAHTPRPPSAVATRAIGEGAEERRLGINEAVSLPGGRGEFEVGAITVKKLLGDGE